MTSTIVKVLMILGQPLLPRIWAKDQTTIGCCDPKKMVWDHRATVAPINNLSPSGRGGHRHRPQWPWSAISGTTPRWHHCELTHSLTSASPVSFCPHIAVSFTAALARGHVPHVVRSRFATFLFPYPLFESYWVYPSGSGAYSRNKFISNALVI